MPIDVPISIRSLSREEFGELDYQVMRHVFACQNELGRLGDEAYGVAVRAAVSKRLARSCSIGAVYTTLQRLENKGFVRSWMSGPTPVRGGRAKRYFALTPSGERAIRHAQATARRLWSGAGLRFSNT